MWKCSPSTGPVFHSPLVPSRVVCFWFRVPSALFAVWLLALIHSCLLNSCTLERSAAEARGEIISLLTGASSSQGSLPIEMSWNASAEQLHCSSVGTFWAIFFFWRGGGCAHKWSDRTWSAQLYRKITQCILNMSSDVSTEAALGGCLDRWCSHSFVSENVLSEERGLGDT